MDTVFQFGMRKNVTQTRGGVQIWPKGGLGYPTCGTHCWRAKGLGAHNPSRTSPSVMNLPESSHVHTLGVTVALCARV